MRLARERAGVGALLLALAMALTACGGPGASPTAASVPSSAVASPVVGRLTGIDAEGLTQVRGFTLRLDDGTEAAFVIGSLENGVEFPPGHLAEHMASSSPVRVFFRDEAGARVVYRIEDAE